MLHISSESQKIILLGNNIFNYAWSIRFLAREIEADGAE